MTTCPTCHQAAPKKPLPSCNLCGEPCGMVVCRHSFPPYDEPMGLVAAVTGGYESTPGNGHGALDDGTTYRFAICEFCLDWLFTQFKIPPQVGWMDGTVDPFRPPRSVLKKTTGGR